MLYFFLSPFISFPVLGYLLNTVYYSMIITGMGCSGVLIYKILIKTGFEECIVRRFVLVSVISAFPLGIISARTANMFYFSPSLWDFGFFWSQMVYGKYLTFHAGLILPVIMISFLLKFMRIQFWFGWDVISMHIPLAHAFGRAGCLMVGCCRGEILTIPGTELTLSNPVPLYALVLNFLLYLFLKKWFNFYYLNIKGSLHYSGIITSYYLIIYGIIRFFTELIRMETSIAFGLTQAQIVMGVFISVGCCILFVKTRSAYSTIPVRCTTTTDTKP